jgi:MFS transporter, DHA2 family, multidrug resistance protein
MTTTDDHGSSSPGAGRPVTTTSNHRAGRREWIALAVIALPSLLYAMDLTVLYLAVPHISADLGPSSSQLLWIVDVYGFLVAGSLITMGTLGDRIGRRRLLLIGAAAFGAASVFAAFATSAAMLIAARALLGIAGATLAPSTLALIRNMFHDPAQRTFAIGVWITTYSAGAAIGPLLGGVVLELFWWGAVFLLGVPVMALLLVVGPRLLPESRDPDAGKLDLVSAALSLVAVLAVIFGLKRIAEHGFGTLPALVIVAGVALGAVFARRQPRLDDPLIDLRLFRAPAFSASLAINTLGFFAAFGGSLFLAQYLQSVLGLSPLEAGLWTLPEAGGFIVGSMLAPVLVRRVRPGVVVAFGLALAAVGFGVLSQIADASGLAALVVGSTLMALGLGPVFTLAADLVVSAAPAERSGAASAINETSSELGGALGIAILGSVGAAVYRSEVADAIPAGAPPAADALRDTLGGAVAAADRLPAGLLDTATGAFVSGFRLTALIAAATLIVGAALAGRLLRGADPGDQPAATPAQAEPPAPPVLSALAAAEH